MNLLPNWRPTKSVPDIMELSPMPKQKKILHIWFRSRELCCWNRFQRCNNSIMYPRVHLHHYFIPVTDTQNFPTITCLIELLIHCQVKYLFQVKTFYGNFYHIHCSLQLFLNKKYSFVNMLPDVRNMPLWKYQPYRIQETLIPRYRTSRACPTVIFSRY